MPTVYFKLLPKSGRTSSSAKQIRDWDVYLRENFPIRFKINNFIWKAHLKLITFPIQRLKDAKYWFLYRFHPKHKYNTIVFDEPGYYDPSYAVLHAPFVVFTEFMDRIYAGKSHVMWVPEEGWEEQFEGEKERLVNRWIEMEELYNWWNKIRPTRREDWEAENPNPYKNIPEDWGFMPMFNDDFRNTPEVIEWKAHAAASNEMSGKWQQDDEDMLIRLMKIRHHLWD